MASSSRSDDLSPSLPETDRLEWAEVPETEALPPSPSPLFSSPSSPPDMWTEEQEAQWATPTEPLPSPASAAASASPGDRSTGKATLTELRRTARALVRTAGGIAHQVLTTPGTPEHEAELYKPDKDDEHAIGNPLASLASRRMPEGADNPDVNDLLQLVMGIAGYVFKQRNKRAALAAPLVYRDPDAEDADAHTGAGYDDGLGVE